MARKKKDAPAPAPDEAFTPDASAAPEAVAQAPAQHESIPPPEDADMDDPIEAAERAAVLATLLESLPEEDVRMIRGLWHADRLLAAVRHYRRVAPKPEGMDEIPISEARAAVEAIVSAGPAPEGFTLPEADEPLPTLEESIVYPLDEAQRLGGAVAPFPRPAPPLTSVPKPPPAPPTGRKVIKTVTEDRRFELDTDAFHAKAVDLANTIRDIGLEEARQAQVKRALKATLGELEERREKLAAEVRDGCEVRSVSVRFEVDYDAGLTREIEAATGRILIERPIDSKEAQVPLFTATGASPTAGKDAGAAHEGDDWPVGDGEDEADDDASEEATAEENPEEEDDQ